MRCILRYAVILLLSCLLSNSQLLAGNLNYKFNSINELFGISMRHASSVCNDDNGFVWASTKTGILRLTADDYRVYQLPFENTNVLTVKLIFSDGVLWAYSNNGQLFKYKPISDKFILKYNLGSVLNNRHLNVTSVLLQGNDICWMATSDGLYMYNAKHNSIQKVINEPVMQLEWRDSVHLFAVSLNNIFLLNAKTNERELLYSGLLGEYYVTYSLYYDQKLSRLWLGSNFKGLYYFDLADKTLTPFMPESFPLQPVMNMEPVGHNTLLVGVDGQGIWSINKETMEIQHVYKDDVDNPDAIRGNGIYDIFHDKEANKVWVCTYSGGVSYVDMGYRKIEHITHQVNQVNSLVNNNINSILEDSDNNLWFATDNGISLWKVAEQRWLHFYANSQEQAQVFLTLCEDKNGQIWAGSYSSGVYLLDRETGKQLASYSQTEPNSPFKSDFVFSIYEDKSGEIWIAGINSEVIRYMPDKNQFRKYFFQPATKIIQYNDSLMLLACSYGLVQLDKNSGEYTTLIDKYTITDILIRHNTIWLGTNGDGLIRYEPASNTITQFTTSHGLISNFVNSVIYSDGYFWLGTENGLCRFSPEKETVVTFSNIFPISTSSFNNNAYYLLSDGRLAMGTNNGVVIFKPSSLEEESFSGQIFFQDISILGRTIRDNPSIKLERPIDQLDQLRLKHRQNTITLELLPVGGPSKAKFSWKLEGLDPDWTLPSSHRLISYNNIPYKSYELKIRMYDSSLSQLIAERSFMLQITPPFWATWWFFTFIFLLVSIVLYSIFWYSINRLKQQHAEEKVRFFTKAAHDIRTSLTLIKAPVEELSNEKNLSERARHFVQIANKQAKHLSSVVTQLLDFQKADMGKEQFSPEMVDVPSLVSCRIEMFESLASINRIKIKKTFKIKHYVTAVDVNQIEKVVDNLLSNAIKYSGSNKKVEVELNGNAEGWVLCVSDQGIGISKSDQKRLFREFYRGENAINSKIVGSGVGLLLVKNIVALHQGSVSFTSHENQGSAFTISIPYKKVNSTKEFGPQTPYDTDVDASKVDENQVKETYVSVNKTLKILIVEDNDELLRFMRLVFDREYHVITAVNGIEGWELVQNEMPDMVISDVVMPKMGGFELCKLMKSTFETSHIPIVLLTALDDSAMLMHGLGLGADDYLTKPFDTELLHQKIRSITHNRNAIREKALRLIQTGQKEPVLNNVLNDQFLTKMLEIVKENMANPHFGKDDFASAMEVSGSLLYKKVKALTDQSPVDFIKSVRMGYALELLQSGKYNITDISEMCGYASAGYFSTVFKKYYGKSPSDV